MKKTLILLIISMILLLVGCGSDSDSNNSDKGLIDQETERIKNEIDKANSMAGVKSTPEPTKEQEPAEPTEIISTPEVQKTLEDMTEEEKFDYYAKNGSYYLGGMNSDEIVNVVTNLLEKYPENGETFDEMIAKYNSPVVFGEQNIYLKGEKSYYSGEPGLYRNKGILINYSEIKDSDYIKTEKHANIYSTQMDGTVTLGGWPTGLIVQDNDYPSVYVELCIRDYKKAVEVYDKLIENEKAFHIYLNDEIEDKREGSSWRVSFSEKGRPGYVRLQYYSEDKYVLSVSRAFYEESLLSPLPNDD